jgi:hypothetical protein
LAAWGWPLRDIGLGQPLISRRGHLTSTRHAGINPHNAPKMATALGYDIDAALEEPDDH